MKNDTLSVTDSSGRQVSLLNNEAASTATVSSLALAGGRHHHQAEGQAPSTRAAAPHNAAGPLLFATAHQPVIYSQRTQSMSTSPMVATAQWTTYRQPAQQSAMADSNGGGSSSSNNNNGSSQANRRKYHCTEPGCNKSFTTSGHLARHNRIHTGEKNFPCLFPGCQSRFSRQDNMMQHYRTHMSPKSRRSHKRGCGTAGDDEASRPRPRLHAHHHIRSDPFGVERPLTIDQHLNNYHRRSQPSPPQSQSLERLSPVREYQDDRHSRSPGSNQQHHDLSALSASLQQQTLSDLHPQLPNPSVHPSPQGASNATHRGQGAPPPPRVDTASVTFYQHRPLTFSLEEATNKTPAPTTLLGPSINEAPLDSSEQQSRRESKGHASSPLPPSPPPPPPPPRASTNAASASPSSSTSTSTSSDSGLLQLAHVVSTFG